MTVISAVLTAAILVLSCLAPEAGAQEAQAAQPLQLRRVMQDLGKNMQAATDAISREDWETLVKLAPAIASHPEPPAGEKIRILGFLGSDAARFRGYDHQTHTAAEEMRNAAARGDGKAVVAAFANVQTNCLGCHVSFRKRFLEHFYGLK